MLKATDEPTILSPFQYRLRAAVTHFGSHGNGHYVCYRPHAKIVTEPIESEDKSSQQSPDESSNNQPCEPSEESPQDSTVEPLNDSSDQASSEALEEQWWRFSDDTVYAVDEEQAHQANVFMLFYERLDEPITTHVTDAESIPATIAVAEDAPLPPASLQICTGDVADTETASNVPLPDDDDLLDLIPPKESKGPSSFIEKIATPTNPPSLPAPTQDNQDTQTQSYSHDTETEMSEAESEDAPSTQVTSDDEMEPSHPPTPKPIMRVPPPAMRTAGNAGARGQGSRQSLPMVSAT
jgi:ubiquitin carboxyl-terminal hydrolase 1